ncbi:hypothetical protein BLOT_011860, partial [Blomia tropicalis]
NEDKFRLQADDSFLYGVCGRRRLREEVEEVKEKTKTTKTMTTITAAMCESSTLPTRSSHQYGPIQYEPIISFARDYQIF